MVSNFFFSLPKHPNCIRGPPILLTLLSYLLTPWNRVVLEKQTRSQLVKKFPTFSATRRFITAFTSVRQLSLSSASSIQSIPPTSHFLKIHLNPLTPNDHYSGRTALLTSKRCILYIYSTNTGTEYYKHGIYSPFFFSLSSKCSLFHNSNLFASCFIHIYIQSVLKFKKNNSGAKRLILSFH